MPRKRAAKPVTTLVPHCTPDLVELLEAAKTCKCEPLRRFLAAGGRPDALVELKYNNDIRRMSPLIFKAIATHQTDGCAFHHEGLTVLLEAGANADAVCVSGDGNEWTALMAACQMSHAAQHQCAFS
eukprot:20553-Heterococcus_DN1.PRE.1